MCCCGSDILTPEFGRNLGCAQLNCLDNNTVMARLQRDFSNSRRERLRRRDVKLRVVDVKDGKLSRPATRRRAHDQLATMTSPRQTSTRGSRLMQRKICAILVSAAKEIRLVEIYMLNMKVGSGVTLLIHLGE